MAQVSASLIIFITKTRPSTAYPINAYLLIFNTNYHLLPGDIPIGKPIGGGGRNIPVPGITVPGANCGVTPIVCGIMWGNWFIFKSNDKFHTRFKVSTNMSGH